MRGSAMYFLRRNHLRKQRTDKVFALPSVDALVVDPPAPIKTVVSIKPDRSQIEPRNPDEDRHKQAGNFMFGTLHKVTRSSQR